QSLSTTVLNLIPGTYIFQLSATDSLGFTANSLTHVFVKASLPPIAKAGGNQVITLPVSSLTLSGTATAGSSTIVSTTWSQTSGPGTAILNTPGSLTTLISNLIQGVYVFRFTIIDSLGNNSFDSAIVTVNAQTPSTINVRLYAGLIPFSNIGWNNWNVGAAPKSNISSGLLNYSDGSASTVSAILSYEDNLADNGAAYTSGATMCPDTALRFASYTTSTRSLTINGLKNTSKYNLEFYASRRRTDGQKTVFTIGSQGITILTDNNSSNAAKFSNLSPSNGHIITSITRGSTYNYLNGFTIVEISGGTSSNLVLDPPLTASTSEEIKTFSIQVNPNPVADQLFILNNGNNAIQVQIFDISGRQLAIYRHISYSYEINMHSLARGTYILIATDERTKETIRKTIIKY
ncbi:MAG TPA: T9SS type A sorting domain-containing protein, partial [Puia sp.]|nr:T9SS type A sorting domain-containing protein [Puia sp.]